MSSWSQDWIHGLEVGGEGIFELAVGDMAEHEVGNVGGALILHYPLPLGLSETTFLSTAEVSVEAAVLFPVGVKSFLEGS